MCGLEYRVMLAIFALLLSVQNNIIAQQCKIATFGLFNATYSISLIKAKCIINILSLMLIVLGITTVYLLYIFKKKMKAQAFEFKIELNKQKDLMLMLEASKTKEELEHLKQELINAVSSIRDRNKILNNIKEQIQLIERIYKGENSDKLHEVCETIDKLCLNTNDLDVIVEKINNTYILKLSQKYPNLNENDKKLAALLIVGMSSKEIAFIINNLPKTVDMARYRLRKKMRLDSDKSFLEELANNL